MSHNVSQKKICLDCGIELTPDSAYIGKGYTATRCKECYSKARKRGYRLKTQYGIDIQEYESMARAQEWRCAICHRKTPVLAVDHDHQTGQIRGLLCQNCNVALGMLDDSEDILLSAVGYLRAYREESGKHKA